MTLIPVHVRWLIKRDMHDVLPIERRSFENPERRWATLEYEFHLQDQNTVGMVAECREGILGVMIYEMSKKTLQVLRFIVDPIYRRCGIGSQMASKLTDKLTSQRRNELLMEVRESNLEGQLFLRNMGFRAVDTFRERYDDTAEDGYLFQYLVGRPSVQHEHCEG